MGKRERRESGEKTKNIKRKEVAKSQLIIEKMELDGCGFIVEGVIHLIIC